MGLKYTAACLYGMNLELSYTNRIVTSRAVVVGMDEYGEGGDSYQHLLLRDVQPSDAGVYTCRLRSSQGTVHRSATLAVTSTHPSLVCPYSLPVYSNLVLPK